VYKNIDQKRIILHQHGFSMVEVIVAAVLFATTAAGVFATISFTNRKVESDTRTQAVAFAKKILGQLNEHVNSSTWDQSNNSLTVKDDPYVVPADADFPGCTGSYLVSDPDGNGGRKVVIEVTCL
jgi:prepilin-type N-terminal cleavage/methylation domain-containing protein